ncbi:MAG: protein kinase [Pirellulales bacterium]
MIGSAEAAALVRSAIDAQPRPDILQGLTRESAEKMLSLAVQGGLLSEAIVSSTRGPPAIEDDPRAIVQRLLDAGRLTTWQCEHLLVGRYKGFFHGRYKLLEHLDFGESSSVFLGEHVTLGTRWTLVMRGPLYLSNPSAMAWLERRLRVVAPMDHVNIVRIHDAETDGRMIHYLVREYVDGCNLAALLNHAVRLSPRLAAALTLQIAEAAAYADSQNCPLPTIEAENVLVSRDGLVKVQPAHISLGYRQNSRIDDQSNGMASGFPPGDVESLGQLLFQLLTGCLPMESNVIEHDLNTLRPAPPDWLKNICLRAVRVSGQKPLPTAADVCQALRQGGARSD